MKRTVLALLCGAALVVSAARHSYAQDSSADKDMADRYFQAARTGDATAQFYLGALYSAGVGRSQSDAEALQWFLRAAEQGHAQAMLILSGLYVIGRGAPKDNVSAYTWASIAESEARLDEIRNGAHQLLTVLESRLTRDEIRRAKADGEDWRRAQGRTPKSSADDVSNDRRRPEPSPPISSQPRPSTFDEPAKPSPAPEAETDKKETDKKLKSEIDDFLSRIPSDLKKRFGQ